VNDINTLNGALQKLGETMADNLVAKGVTASASDGLTTLAGKILDIQTGGSCYHIEFSEASYTAVGGSATLEVYLQENYAPKSSASVTVTGSDGSVYNGITNSQGLAEITVSNITGTVTFTASYSNVTDTCTVTVQTYLCYDACDSASGLSNYGSVYSVENNTNATITYDSTMNAYKISNTGGGAKLFPITALTGLTSLHLEAEFYLPSTTNRNTSCGLEVVGTNHTSWGTVQNKVDNLYGYHIFRNNSFVENVTAKSGANLNEWIRFKIDIDGVNVTYSFEQLDGTVIYQSTTLNLSTLVGSTYYTTVEDRQYGIGIAWNSYNCYSYVRNIKATTL
jgi:hypothetical protein